MAAHWSIRAALMFGPPHFAFQLLAYASARLTERIAAGRAERARLEERLELSRELHDIAGHRLTALSLNLQVLQRTVPAETLPSPAAAGAAHIVAAPAGAAPLVGRTVAAVERDLILETLNHCLGNRTHAANILGISIRTLRNKLKQYSTEGMPMPDGAGELERQAV